MHGFRRRLSIMLATWDMARTRKISDILCHLLSGSLNNACAQAGPYSPLASSAKSTTSHMRQYAPNWSQGPPAARKTIHGMQVAEQGAHQQAWCWRRHQQLLQQLEVCCQVQTVDLNPPLNPLPANGKLFKKWHKHNVPTTHPSCAFMLP